MTLHSFFLHSFFLHSFWLAVAVAAQGLGPDPQKDACLCKVITAPHKGTSTTQKYANICKHIRTHILYLSISQTLTQTLTHTLTNTHTHSHIHTQAKAQHAS